MPPRTGWFTGPGTLLGDVFGVGVTQQELDAERRQQQAQEAAQRARALALQQPPVQGRGESNLAFGFRRVANGPPIEDSLFGHIVPPAGLSEPTRFMLDTPAMRQQRAQQRAQRDAAVQPAPATAFGGLPDPTGGMVGGSAQGPQPFNPFANFRSTSAPGDPRDGGRRVHQGRDWAMPLGTPIRAPLPFTVLRRANDPSGYGMYMDVRFSDGSEQRFGHLSKWNTDPSGPAGQIIGLSGASGNATGPSVHVETHINGNKIDPQEYFGAFGTQPRGLASVQPQMQAALGQFGAPPPPFDPSGYQAAFGFSQKAADAAMRPVSVRTTEAPRPDRAAPEAFAQPDYTAGNAAFEAARPTDPFNDPKEAQRVVREGMFKGMAQALGSINWGQGVGLGELFAKLGAGMLGGKFAGDDYIRGKREEFDKEMEGYQRALASRDDTQAANKATVLNENIRQRNEYNNQTFADHISEWARNLPSVEGGNLITRRPGPNGTMTITTTPISNAPIAAMYNRNAEIAMGLGNAQNQYNWQTFGAAREDARTALSWALVDPHATPQQQDQSMLYDVADRVNALVASGTWKSLFSDSKEADTLQQQAYSAAGVDPRMVAGGLPITHDQQSKVDNFLASQLIALHINGGAKALKQLYQNPAATAAYIAQTAEHRRTSTRTDPRGRQTTSSSEAFNY